jgi:hypothetical protein
VARAREACRAPGLGSGFQGVFRVRILALGFWFWVLGGWGSGFMVHGLGFRVWGLGFGVKVSGFRVWVLVSRF